MAEVLAALAVVASVAQLADYGFKLSIKLFNFSEAVSSVDKSIAGISSDMSLTSTVLKELCQIIQDDKSRVVSEGALIATAQTVKDCLSIFEELEGALDKSMGVLAGAGSDGKGKTSKRRIVGERLKWPFKQQKMELLRSNLDRLKASLTLMLQVLSYARDVSNRKVAETSLQYQQHLIESLARSEKDMKRKYYELQRAVEFRNPPPYFSATVNDVYVSSSRDLGINSNSLATDTAWPSSVERTNITELSLFLHLFIDLLSHYIAIVKNDEDLSHLSNAYEQLRVILNDLRPEHQSFEGNFSEQSGAASNLMNRISKVLNSMSLEVNEIPHLPRLPNPGSSTDDYAEGSPLDSNNPGASPNPTNSFRMPAVVAQPAEIIPISQSGDIESTNSATQAELNQLTEMMRQNILKILEKGERLDSLNDDGEIDKLRVASGTFRRASKQRQQEGLLTKAYHTITGLGSMAYNAGASLIPSYPTMDTAGMSMDEVFDAQDLMYNQSWGEYLASFWPKTRERSRYWDEDALDCMDENGEATLDKLLAKWTNLPPQEEL